MFLSWIPILGPIINGIVSVFNKRADANVAINSEENKTKRSQIEADTSRSQIGAGLTTAFKDDIGSQLNRDLIMFTVSLWVCLKGYYLMFHNLIPDYTWNILDWPESIAYLPYAVVGFLFGILIKNKYFS